MLKRILMCVAAVLLGGVSALACSIPTFGTLSFDPTQNIFVGQVTGFVETNDLRSGADPSRFGDFASRTAGVVVKVKGTFYTTKADIPTYEIYRLGVAPDCTLYGTSLEQVKEWYKVGDYVGVVLGDSRNVLQPDKTSVGRLELRYGKHDSVTVLQKSDLGNYVLNDVFNARLKLLREQSK